jgi:hypothetical protein
VHCILFSRGSRHTEHDFLGSSATGGEGATGGESATEGGEDATDGGDAKEAGANCRFCSSAIRRKGEVTILLRRIRLFNISSVYLLDIIQFLKPIIEGKSSAQIFYMSFLMFF